MWIGYAEGRPTGTHWVFNPKTKKIILTQDVTFLQKFYIEYTKVEKPVLVTMSYEGLNDEEELKMVSIVNENNNVNKITDIKNDNENVFNKDIDNKVEVTPKTTINAKVTHAMKKLQALFDNGVNKIIKQAKKEKCAIKN